MPTALIQRFVGCVLGAGGGAAASEFTSQASQKGASWNCLLAWSEVCSSCVWEGAPSTWSTQAPSGKAAAHLGWEGFLQPVTSWGAERYALDGGSSGDQPLGNKETQNKCQAKL